MPFSDPIRRLALEALLSLARTAQASFTSDNPSSIIEDARYAILSLLLPPPPSAVSSSSGKRHRSSRQSTFLPLPLLLALSNAISPSSPLHPALPSSSDRLRLQASILRKILDATSDEHTASSRKGVAGGWTLSTVLDGLRKELDARREKGEKTEEAGGDVAKVVLDVVEQRIGVSGDSSDGACSDLCRFRLIRLTLSPFPCSSHHLGPSNPSPPLYKPHRHSPNRFPTPPPPHPLLPPPSNISFLSPLRPPRSYPHSTLDLGCPLDQPVLRISTSRTRVG